MLKATLFVLIFISSVNTLKLIDHDQGSAIDTTYWYRLTTMWQGDKFSLDIINDGINNKLQLAATGSYTGQFWKFT